MLIQKKSRFASLLLAGFLQVAPFARQAVDALPLAASPVAIVLKWAVATFALAGAYHTVSAASATLVSASKVNGTVGTRVSYQIKINDGQNRQPGSWTINGINFKNSGSTTTGMPPGLSLSLSTGIISGIPTTGGSFPTAITAWEDPGQRGAHLNFTVTFTFTGGDVAPSITTQPVGADLKTGDPLSLNVVASGTAPLTYQWAKNAATISGATSAAFSITHVATSDAGSYTVTVSGPGGTITSSAAVVTVVDPVIAPAITTQPEGTTLHPGEALSLAVTATGTATLTYQWKKNDTNITGATNAVFSIPAISPADAATYRVVINGPGGTTESSGAEVSTRELSISFDSLGTGGFFMTLQTIPGRSYVVEAVNSLDGLPGSWTPAGTVTATGDTETFADKETTGNARFWRYRPAQP